MQSNRIPSRIIPNQSIFLRSLALVYAIFSLVAFDLTASEILPLTKHPDFDAVADELEFLHEENLLKGSGNVTINYHGLKMTADQVELNTDTRAIRANGNVTLQYADIYWEGGSIEGNLESKEFAFNEYRSHSEPWYLVGGGGALDTEGTITAKNISLSTCDYLFGDTPHWRMQCSEFQYFADKRFRAYNVVYKIGGIPVFYLPVVSGHTEKQVNNVHLSAGYESDSGVFAEVAKDWELNDDVKTEAGIIYRSQRGMALRNSTELNIGRSRTDFFAYGMRDRDPLSDATINGVDFNGRFESQEDRYRLKLSNKTPIYERLSLQVHADHFSDNDLLLEFFKKDFRSDPQPVSFANLSYSGDYLNVSLNYRPRLNNFESVVERLPELRIETPRLGIADSGLYFRTEATASSLRMRWREYDLPRSGNLKDPKDYETGRFDALNFLYYPFRVEFLSIVPRLGARGTYYTRTSGRDITIEQLNSNILADDPRPALDNPNPVFDYDDDGGSHLRFAAELGAELSFKIYRHWPDVRSERWEIEGLRHIVQPFLNYTYIPNPSVDDDNLFFFDELDRIDKNHFVRLGMRHQFQTKRESEVYTLVSMENFYDFYMSPGDHESRPGDFGTVVDIRPSEQFSLWAKFLMDTDRGDMNVINTGAGIGEKDKFRTQISYLYRQSFSSRFNYSMDSNLTQILSSAFLPTSYDKNHNLHVDFDVPLNGSTRLSCKYFFDLNRDTLSRQSYQLTHDLHCWTGALGFEQDENDFSVYLLMYLKAFPKFKLDFGS